MSLNKLLIASNNPKKIAELSLILSTMGFECLSLAQAGFNLEPEENGTTFTENARIKATTVCNATGLVTIADDSGLCCNALGGQPGVLSARYCEGSDSDRTAHLLKNMEGVADYNRTAYFACAICCAFPNGDLVEAYGQIEGSITHKVAGSGGFGYDPVFFLTEYSATFSEIPLEFKNKISHRANALKSFSIKLKEYMENKEC